MMIHIVWASSKLNVDLRYCIYVFLLIMIMGIFKTSNPAGTFLLPFFIPILVSMVILLILLISFHHMDTILVVLLTLYLTILY